MKKRRIILSSLLFVLFHGGYSQVRKCAVGGKNNDLEKYEQLQKFIERAKFTYNRQARTEEEVITIPIVVHVIHANESGIIGGSNNGNISDEQILSQIKVLNNDFRRLPNTLGFNSNPVGADMELNFALAQTTPSGLPTNGIIREYNPKRSYDVFGDNDLLSSLSYWDSERYLNIWVTTLSDNYIGYAEFPTGDFNGLDFDETNAATDGVIIDHTAFGNRTGTASFGSYSYGRTTTHEIGHWFGLIHTWGDSFCGTDYCEDTPQVAGPNNTNLCVAQPSRCDRVSRLPMIENYLDYTPDSCMNIFTQDQKGRVRAILKISQRRDRLVKAAKLNFQPVATPTLSIINNPGTNTSVQISIKLPDFQNFTINLYTLSGKLIATKDYIDFPGALISVNELTKTNGVFFVQLQTATTSQTRKIITF
jgi:hypothetical protein